MSVNGRLLYELYLILSCERRAGHLLLCLSILPGVVCQAECLDLSLRSTAMDMEVRSLTGSGSSGDWTF